MSQLNGNYSNSTNVAVLGTSAHETSEIQVFNSPIFGEIRVATDRNGNPLFCLVDICTSIGIVNHRNVKNRLDNDDVHMIDTLTNGGLQSMVYVTESGMYDVVLRSDSPKAKPFKKWVTGDVLLSIRKTGSYSLQPQLPNFNNPAEAAFKKIRFSFGSLRNCCSFAVLQIIIIYAKGIFYAQKASIFKYIEKLYPCIISRWQMIVCSKIGYDFSFFINNK